MTQILAQYGHLIGYEKVGWGKCPCACHDPKNELTHEHVCCLPTRGEFDRFKCAVKKIEDEEERKSVEKMIERIDLVFKTNGHISSDLQSLSMGPLVGVGALGEANRAFISVSSLYGQFDDMLKARSRRPVILEDEKSKQDEEPLDAVGNFDEDDAFDF